MKFQLPTGRTEPSAKKKGPHVAPLWIHKTKSAAWLTLIGCIALAFTSFAENPYLMRTFEENGRLIDEVLVPPSPPPAILEKAVAVPKPDKAKGNNSCATVPAFTWCYGCSATSAGMMMGYYDNQGLPNMYTGPANGGVCPMNNETYWGHTAWPFGNCGECPLVATHIGKDGRTARGYVEDYWIDSDNPGPDPYIVNGWTEHTSADCTGDFMGTSQSKFESVDGATWFYFGNNNAPLSDYTACEPARRDGCHGMKLFVESRGYTVTANYSQYIYGYNGVSAGFSYDNFKTEIDAGRPVIIQVVGHTMLGFGYNTDGNIIYIHDTWDNSDHQMTWGGKYSSMQHYGVTVLQVQGANPPPPPPVVEGSPVLSDYDGDWYADLGIFRSDGSWHLFGSSAGYIGFDSDAVGTQFSVQPGDFDGDRFSDPAVYDSSSAIWYFMSSYYGYSWLYINRAWLSGGIPACNDFDGDRRADPIAYDSSNGSWYILSSIYGWDGHYYKISNWGGSAFSPVCADFDGDRKADPMAYDTSSGYWWILTSRSVYTRYFKIWFGISSFTPVSGDFDGDRYADLGIYEKSSGTWAILLSSTGWNSYICGEWDGSP